MKKEIIQTFFLGDEEFFKECISRDFSYYLSQLKERMEAKTPPYEKQKLLYINFLLLTISKKFKNHDALNHMDLYQFFKAIYNSDRIKYSTLLEVRINKLISYLGSLKEEGENAEAYKKTAAYSGSEDRYFEANNTIHNKILDITTNFNLDSLPDKSSLQQKAFGNTPLVLACKIGHTQAALILIKSHEESGININQADEKGMTPLHWACFYRDKSLIDALLNAGASTQTTNNDGDMPLSLYTEDIDTDTTIHSAGKQGLFPNIPSIADGQLKYVVNEQSEKKSSWIDIVFHMDKIAFHQLHVSLNQLNQEVCVAKASLPENSLETQPNLIFEVFTFYHFNNFINTRNQIKADTILIDKLTPPQKINNADQDEAPLASKLPLKTTSEASQFSQQLKETFKQGIEDYIFWRNNKDMDSPRGYKNGFFTKMRHWTRFGEERALQLNEKLVSATTDLEVITILCEHFNQNSRLHNHSLDTYLLEGLIKTNLLPIQANLRTKEGRELYLLTVTDYLNEKKDTLTANSEESTSEDRISI